MAVLEEQCWRSATASQPVDFDVVVVGAGFAGLYAIHVLREHGFTARASTRRATASAARGSGTAIPAPASTSRAASTCSPSSPRSSRSGTGPSSCRPRRRSSATSTSSPTGSISAATSSSRPRSTALTFDEATSTWTVDTVDRRGGAVVVRHRRHRLPVGADRARHRRAARLRRRHHVHQPVPEGRLRLHRQARRRRRHRLVGRAVDPGHRRAGRRSCTCCSARRRTRCRRRTVRSNAGELEALKAEYPEIRKAQWASPIGIGALRRRVLSDMELPNILDTPWEERLAAHRRARRRRRLRVGRRARGRRGERRRPRALRRGDQAHRARIPQSPRTSCRSTRSGASG